MRKRLFAEHGPKLLEVNWASQLNGTQTRTQGAVTAPLPCGRAAACPLPSPAAPRHRQKDQGFSSAGTHLPTGLDVCRQQAGDSNPAPPWSCSHPAENPGMSSVPPDPHAGITSSDTNSHQATQGHAGFWVHALQQENPEIPVQSYRKAFHCCFCPLLHCIAPASLPQLLTLLITHSCLTLPD